MKDSNDLNRIRISRSEAQKYTVTETDWALAAAHRNDVKMIKQARSEAEKKDRSWKAPLFMAIGLLSGTAFASGHHFFYNSLNGQTVNDATVPQTWIIRIGTLFAFLTKLSCVLAVSTAYVQLQWYNSRKSSLSVQNLDALTSVLYNILSLFDSSVFLHFPILATLALICWALPIVPVITPGTINVIQALSHNVTQMQVSQPGFYNSTFEWLPNTQAISLGFPIPPATALSQTAFATGVTDRVLSCNPAFLNSTYTLQFSAPVFKCQDLSTAVAAELLSKLNVPAPLDLVYLSWTPGDPWVTSGIPNTTLPIDQQLYPLNVDFSSFNATRLYIMTDDGSVSTSSVRVANVTEYSLFNATYTANFSFTDGKQSVAIEDIEIGASIAASQQFNGSTLPGLESYTALAASLGTLLVGFKTFEGVGITEIDYTSIDLLHIDISNVTSGVERLFQNIVLSTFCNPELAISSAASNVTVSSSVQKYSYAPFSLVLTYSLALLVSIFCSIIGMYAFIVNKSSCQNSFSSFMRATSGLEVHRLVQIDDDGADPRPKTLAKATIIMTGRKGSPSSPASLPRSQMPKTRSIPRKPVPAPT